MKWLVIASFIVCLATLSNGSALRSTPDSKDAASSKYNVKREVKQLSRGAECLPRSSWKSKCNSCFCSEDGHPACTDMACPGQEDEPERTCASNTTWKIECNTCYCSPHGHASCTRMGCGLFTEVKQLSRGAECLPRSSWKSKCNSCFCSEDGHPACTDMACPGQEDEPERTCAPDTTWKIECNTCYCSPHGHASCTRMGCGLFTVTDFNPVDDEEDKPELDDDYYFEDRNLVKRSRICRPNALLKADCNFCKCASDGESYSCTLKECLEPEVSDDVEVFKEIEDADDEDQANTKVCKPRGTLNIGCNTCRCNIDGTNFTCTNKPCPLPADVELFHELRVLRSSSSNKSVVCAANRMFVKDCNTCWCNEDGTSYFCTRKVCIAELPDDVNEEKPENLQEIKRKCRPDEVFELDCNTCRCSQDGTSFSCTRKACMPEEKGKNVSLNRRIRASSQGAPKACQPGQEFRMDCNKCLCNNEGQDYSCTRIDCAALNSNGNAGVRTKREVTTQVKPECEPGSVFNQGCNPCRCTDDGNHATCALKRCKENANENDKNLPESDPSFRCNPGEQYKRDCNDCTCSADGKSIFCTLRFCDQDITPTI